MARGLILAALLTACASLGVADAQVYKCSDGKGGFSYTDKACSIDSEPIKTRPTGFGGSKRMVSNGIPTR